MNSHMAYLDGNAAAGELSDVFAMDVTAAEGECAHCGAKGRFAETHVYMRGPGVVARCAACHKILLRFVKVGQRVFFDVRGLAYLSIDRSHVRAEPA